MTWTFERKHRFGVPDSSQHAIYENGTPRFTAWSEADAMFLTNLLNLTTPEQQYKARVQIFEAAAE